MSDEFDSAFDKKYGNKNKETENSLFDAAFDKKYGQSEYKLDLNKIDKESNPLPYRKRERTGITGIGGDVLHSTLGVAKDALGLITNPKKTYKMGQNLIEELGESGKQVNYNPRRAVKNIVGGLATGARAIANIPAETAEYFARKDIISPETAAGVIRPREANKRDYFKELMLGDTQKGDLGIRTTSELVPAMLAGEIGLAGKGRQINQLLGLRGPGLARQTAQRSGAMAAHAIGKGEDPVRAALEFAGTEAAARGIYKAGRKAFNTGIFGPGEEAVGEYLNENRRINKDFPDDGGPPGGSGGGGSGGGGSGGGGSGPLDLIDKAKAEAREAAKYNATLEKTISSEEMLANEAKLKREQSEQNLIKANEKIENIAPSEHNIETTKKIIEGHKNAYQEALENRVSSSKMSLEEKLTELKREAKHETEAGEGISRPLQRRVARLEDEYNTLVQPYYTILSETENRIPITRTNLERAERAPLETGKERGISNKIGRETTTNEFLNSNRQNAALQEIENANPDLGQDLRDIFQASNIEMLPPRAGKVVEIIKELNKSWEQATKYGNRTLARNLGRYKSLLENDFFEHASPEVAEAYQQTKDLGSHYYGEIGNITNDNAMKNAVKENRLTGQILKSPETLPKMFVTSRENAQNLFRQTHDNPIARQNMEDYIKKLYIDEVVPNGVVNKKTLDDFLNKYPGAETLYPTIRTRLGNISNATKFYHDSKASLQRHMEKYEGEVVQHIFHDKPHKVIDKLLSTNNPVKEWKHIEELTNKHPDGMAGVKRELGGRFAKDISKLKKYSDFSDYMREHDKLIRTAYSPNQIKVFDQMGEAIKEVEASIIAERKAKESGESLKRISGKKPPSKTMIKELVDAIYKQKESNFLVDTLLFGTTAGAVGMIPKFGSVGKQLIKSIYGAYKTSKNEAIEKTVIRALEDDEFAKALTAATAIDAKRHALKSFKNYKYGTYVKESNYSPHETEK